MLWFRKSGPFLYGMDMSTWGFGLMVTFKFPSGCAIHVGPFFVRFELCDVLEAAFWKVDTLLTAVWRWRGRSGI